MEIYLPFYTRDVDLLNEQLFLNKVFLPQMSNSRTELYKFFRENQESVKNETRKQKELTDKFINLNPTFGCNFESYARFAFLRDRAPQIEFMENLKPQQLAAMQPYARFYFMPEEGSTRKETLKSAIPIIFDKGFDLEYFLKNRQSTSRGEGAGLISISCNRIYDVTGDYDPITLNASFFFSSYDVFVNKQAIDKSQLFGVTYNSNLSAGGVRTGFFNQIKNRNVTYKELIKRPLPSKTADSSQKTQQFSLLLEYGWTYAEGVSSDILSPAEKRIIDRFERTYYKLAPKTHTIDFNPDGSFNLNVEYVPTFLDVIDRAVNFKTGAFNFPGIGNKATATFNKVNTFKEEIADLTKENRKKTVDEGVKEVNNEAIKTLQSQLEETQNQFSEIFADQFTELARQRNLFYYFRMETKKSDKTYESKLSVSVPVYGNKKDIIKNPDFQVTKKYFVEDVLGQLKILLNKVDVKDLFSDGETVSNDIVEEILDNMLVPDNKEGVLEGTFMLLKDVFRLVYHIAGDNVGNVQYTTAGNKSKNPPLPYHIFGNIAFPSFNGRKFWCNIGDIPISQILLRDYIVKFVKAYPTGTPRQFIVYFLQKVLPNICVNKKQRIAFPNISTPFYHFNSTSFRGQQKLLSAADNPLAIGLFQGNDSVFKKFCEEYFKESEVESSEGCFFIGQSSSIFHENTKFSLGDKVQTFNENFFRDDKKLKEAGVGKMIIGSSKGVVKNISFKSSSSETTENLSYSLGQTKSGVPDELIATNFQYSLTAEMFGNRIYEFSNLVYVPSWSFGKAAPSLPKGEGKNGELSETQIEELRKSARANDFEIGGLYVISNVTDVLQLANGSYTKTINASCVQRDSTALISKLSKFNKKNKGILIPLKYEDVALIEFITNNIKKIKFALRRDIEVIKEFARRSDDFGFNKDLRQQTQLSLSSPEDKEKLKEEFAPDSELSRELENIKINDNRKAIGLEPVLFPSLTNTGDG